MNVELTYDEVVFIKFLLSSACRARLRESKSVKLHIGEKASPLRRNVDIVELQGKFVDNINKYLYESEKVERV